MSYSDKNPAWDRMHKGQHDARIQREVQRANELQAKEPGLSRDAALRRASLDLDQAG